MPNPDDIYGSRYCVHRCWCGRPDCRRWCVGDAVHGTVEASMYKHQAEAVAFVLNSLEDEEVGAVTVTTARGTKTKTLDGYEVSVASTRRAGN